jgi:hypothetical protein
VRAYAWSAALLATFGAGWWLSTEPDVPATPEAASAASAPRTAAAIAYRPAPALAPTLRSSPRATEASPTDRRAPDEGTAPTIDEQREHLQAAFEAQVVDPSWSAEAARALDADLARFANADVHIGRVECRATLCRAELTLARADIGEAFVQSWVRGRAVTGPGTIVANLTEAAPTLIVFVAKPDTVLPQG